MKVCLLNDSFPPVIDGVANVVLNYAKILNDEALAAVEVGTPRYPEAEYEGYPYKVVPYQSFDTTSMVEGYRAGNPLSRKAVDELAAFRPDIIHTHCPVASTAMARLLREKTGAPIVFTYHTKFDVDIARAVKLKSLQKEGIRLLVDNIASCDEVWVVSEGAGLNLRSLGYEGEYRVVSNGVDFEKGKADPALVKEATEGFDLPGNLPVFLFVGRLMTYKGLPLILSAMKLLSDKGQDFRMVFIGSGDDGETMKKVSAEYGFPVDCRDEDGRIKSLSSGNGRTGRIIFTGAIRDREALRAWNTRSDIFLFPSTYDTNGIVVREAAACGLASVLIKGSCAAEGISDGRNGFLIDESPEELAALLSELCRDIAKMHEAGAHAMDEIYISWHRAVLDAHKRYTQILEMKAGGHLAVRKKQPSDSLVNVAVKLQEATDKVFDYPNAVYEGMLENFHNTQRIYEDIWENLLDRGRELRDSVKENMSELRSKVKSGFESAWRDS